MHSKLRTRWDDNHVAYVLSSVYISIFFLIKAFYYLKVLSITPGLCITRMHTAQTSSEDPNHMYLAGGYGFVL